MTTKRPLVFEAECGCVVDYGVKSDDLDEQFVRRCPRFEERCHIVEVWRAAGDERCEQRYKRAVPNEGEDAILVLYGLQETEGGEMVNHAVRLGGPLARQVINCIEADESGAWDPDYSDMPIIDGVYLVNSAEQSAPGKAKGGAG